LHQFDNIRIRASNSLDQRSILALCGLKKAAEDGNAKAIEALRAGDGVLYRAGIVRRARKGVQEDDPFGYPKFHNSYGRP